MLISCKDYIFQLTSGQSAQARGWMRARGTYHRLICTRCRAFTRNDAALDRLLAHYRAQLQTELVDAPPEASTGGARLDDTDLTGDA